MAPNEFQAGLKYKRGGQRGADFISNGLSPKAMLSSSTAQENDSAHDKI